MIKQYSAFLAICFRPVLSFLFEILEYSAPRFSNKLSITGAFFFVVYCLASLFIFLSFVLHSILDFPAFTVEIWNEIVNRED